MTGLYTLLYKKEILLKKIILREEVKFLKPSVIYSENVRAIAAITFLIQDRYGIDIQTQQILVIST